MIGSNLQFTEQISTVIFVTISPWVKAPINSTLSGNQVTTCQRPQAHQGPPHGCNEDVQPGSSQWPHQRLGSALLHIDLRRSSSRQGRHNHYAPTLAASNSWLTVRYCKLTTPTHWMPSAVQFRLTGTWDILHWLWDHSSQSSTAVSIFDGIGYFANILETQRCCLNVIHRSMSSSPMRRGGLEVHWQKFVISECFHQVHFCDRMTLTSLKFLANAVLTIVQNITGKVYYHLL